MKNKVALAVGLLSALSLSGCAMTSTTSGDVYRSHQVQTAQEVTFGTIISVRPVQIQGESATGNLVGGVGGAVIGGLLGNQIGGGSGQRLATVAGALGGAVAGSHVENAANRVAGQEIEVRTDAGRSLVIVQRADRDYMPRQRVRLIGTGNQLRVAPY